MSVLGLSVVLMLCRELAPLCLLGAALIVAGNWCIRRSLAVPRASGNLG